MNCNVCFLISRNKNSFIKPIELFTEIVKIKDEVCVSCNGFRKFKEDYKTKLKDKNFNQQIRDEIEKAEWIVKESVKNFENIQNESKQDIECYGKEVREFYDKIVKELENLISKVECVEQIFQPAQKDIISNEYEILKNHLLIDFYKLVRNELILEFTQAEDKPCKIILTVNNESTYEYSFDVIDSHTLFAGKNCFLLMGNKILYEIKDGLYERNETISLTSVNIDDSNNTLYGLNTKTEPYEFPIFYEWDDKEKVFKESVKNFFLNTYSAPTAVVFIQNEHVILFDKYLKNFKRVKYFWTVLDCKDKKVEEGQIYVLRDEIDLECYSLNTLDNPTPETVKVKVLNRQMSIRNEIINPVINGNLLMRNDQYVFIINPKTKMANAYPHDKIFTEGQIRACYFTENQFNFCILKSFYPNWKYMVKSFSNLSDTQKPKLED